MEADHANQQFKILLAAIIGCDPGDIIRTPLVPDHDAWDVELTDGRVRRITGKELIER